MLMVCSTLASCSPEWLIKGANWQLGTNNWQACGRERERKVDRERKIGRKVDEQRERERKV